MLLLTCLYVIIMSILCTVSSSSTKPTVLIIGATGRVGQAVTSILSNRPYNLRFLVRNLSEETKNMFVNCQGGQFFEGDVANRNMLMKATEGCDAVIDVHGMKPPRFTKLMDIFRHPKHDPTHPYNVNFVGVKNVLSAMKENKVPKYIRITGATVGKNPFFSPFRVLFAILLSLSGKWHEASEIAIRDSGIDYTVLRPTGIKSEPSALAQNRSLVLIHADSNEKCKIPAKISVTDLADLVVLSLTNKKLKYCSVICSSTDTPGLSNSWENLINEKVPSADKKKLTVQPYKLAITMYLTMFFTFFVVVTNHLILSIAKILN